MVFTMFVNNVPPKVHWRWLGRVFQRFGNVIDVFILRKRNRMGSKMGFVRFGSINKARKTQLYFNGVWFLDYKISVNFAKYNPRMSFLEKNRRIQKETMEKGVNKVILETVNVGQSQSFSNVDRRSYSKALLEGAIDQRKQQVTSLEFKDRNGDHSKPTSCS
ncbi:hypothetical protein REPUB_Repub03eG0140000 [Reevesia pubescens]